MTEPMPDEARIIHITEPESDEVDEDTLDPRARAVMQKIRHEAAGLRARLHELESEHEGAVTRLSAMEHAEVERHAAEYLIDPSDVWRAQPDLTAYYDAEFKQVVGDKVREAAEAVIASKPHLAKPPSAPPPSDRPIEALRPGARAEEKPAAVTWASALRGR